MTIRPMKRAGLYVLVILAPAALLLPACGPGEEDTAAAEAAAAEQADKLEDALAQIEELQGRAEDLEGELDELKGERADAGARLDQVTDRLWKSLGKLRGSLTDMKATAALASDDAASAVANAGAALRDLTILENRFEYHLRQHGGG